MKESLHSTYTKLSAIHSQSFPEQRIGQYLLNLLGYINSTGRDPFFISSSELLSYAAKYASDHSPYFQGSNLSVYKKGDSHVADK